MHEGPPAMACILLLPKAMISRRHTTVVELALLDAVLCHLTDRCISAVGAACAESQILVIV